ncbi:Ribonuclease H domain [Arabidopsis suecica]|uniref:Ribonuclease H domain n=1 Tax=Arabidopsis suecica TaxID=45249 RepID=A0A8T2BPG8_ARASU|nr:Ribonuclease H domain [Arabidopsis suecica]
MGFAFWPKSSDFDSESYPEPTGAGSDTNTMSNFWWNESEEKHKMHWVSWEKICKSKTQGGLGFRDIGHFNQALLAKQAWRLLDVPTSLLARVFKARYYPQKPFLDATTGYRPSYAWRSIIFGKELLEKGLMKAIGNGQSTSVWIDKWLFDGVPRSPMNKESLMDISLKVSSLITIHGEWNSPLLNELFPPCDVNHIRSFPPVTSMEDRHIWAYTKDGQYSVKSGNWLLTHAASRLETTTEALQALNKIKDRIWLLKTAPKIQMFLWRSLSGALAVADSLSLPVHGFTESIADNMLYVFNLMKNMTVPANIRDALPWLLWGSESGNRQASYIEKSWLKPAWGGLKCNVHASWIKDSVHCGGAWLLRNHMGYVVLHARDAFLPMVNRVAAELFCILWCLRSLHSVRIHSCEIWSDCNAAVQALNHPQQWPKYRSLLIKIDQVIRVMRDVKFMISSPKANTLARDIVCSVTREGRFNSYLASGGPAWLQDRLEEERRHG